jgi:hypothetical protein
LKNQKKHKGALFAEVPPLRGPVEFNLRGGWIKGSP